MRTVVEQGLPLVFERSRDSTTALAISFDGPNGVRQDTLRFGGDGRAMLWLPPGTYRYRMAGPRGGVGTVAVDTWSREWLARPVVAHGAAHAVGRRRASGGRRASGRGSTCWCCWRSRPNGWHAAGSGCADRPVRFPP